jgi:ribonuclease P protein component
LVDRPRGATRRRPRLSRSADFQRVYRQGDSVASRHFVLYAFPRDASADEERAAGVRFGVSVGRRVGGAVERNRVKRLLREAFWSVAGDVGDGHDFVIVARPPAGELAEREGERGIEAALREVLTEAGMAGGQP